MANETQIRSSQIQNATPEEGIVSAQLHVAAGIKTAQLEEGANFIKKDGSVEMSAPLVVPVGTQANHTVNKGQLDLAVSNSNADVTGLQESIANLTVAVNSADAALGVRIDTAAANLAAELVTARAAETAIGNTIAANEAANQTAHNSLQTSIDGLQTSTLSSIADVNGRITAEENARAAAIVGVQTDVSNLLLTKADLNGNSVQAFAVANPTQAYHAIPLSYLEGKLMGLDSKDSCRVATTEAIILNGLQTIDGIALNVGNRVLVKDQADKRQNGLYTAQIGDWVRTADADNTPAINAEFTAALYTYIEEGLDNVSSGWTVSSPNSLTYTINGVAAIELGVDNITFTQFTGAGQIIVESTLIKHGNTLGIADTGVAAGSYTKVTVSATGQVTVGENPTTLSGYGITDAANIAGSQTQAFQVAPAAATFDAINKGQLDSAVTTLNQAITTAGGDVAAEAAARIAQDEAAATALVNETTLRTEADETERLARLAGDAASLAAVSQEATDRAAAITAVNGNIDVLTQSIATEASTARTNEGTLQTNIDNAVLSLNNEETTRQTNDEAIIAAHTNDMAAVNASILDIQTAATQEVTDRTAADTALGARIDATDATVAQEVLDRATAVSNVEAAFAAADTALGARIDAVNTGLTGDYYTAVQVDQKITDLIGGASALRDTFGEIEAAMAADETAAAAIVTSVNNEVTRATGVESGLRTDVTALQTAVTTEIADARAAELIQANNLAAEVARATGAEEANGLALTTETTNRINAIAALIGDNGVERSGDTFQIKLAAELSGLVADSQGLRLADNVMLTSSIITRDPFSGILDGVNTVFEFSQNIIPGSEKIYVGGLRQSPGTGKDYLITGRVVTFFKAPSITSNLCMDALGTTVGI